MIILTTRACMYRGHNTTLQIVSKIKTKFEYRPSTDANVT